MKKRIAVILAGTALFTSAVSCTDADEEYSSSLTLTAGSTTAQNETETEKDTEIVLTEPEETVTTRVSTENEYAQRPEGRYFSFYGETYRRKFRFPLTYGLDFLIEEQLFQNQQYADQEKDALKAEGLKAFEFKDGSFAYSFGSDMYPETIYSGNYSMDGNRIVFSYEQYYNKERSGEEITVDINDPPESYDKDKLDNGTEEEKKAEDKKARRKFVYDHMAEMNEQGLYYSRLAPLICYTDRFNDFGMLPILFVGQATADRNQAELYQIGDLLGFRTYGMSLDGDYVPGESFTLDFDQMYVIANDPYGYTSKDRSDEETEKFFGSMKDALEKHYSLEESEDLSTVFYFDNGTWEWENAEGNTINSGSYQESELYPGLIAMYVDDTSRLNEENTKLVEGYGTIMLYIGSDGQIYHPYFIKDHKVDAEAVEKLRRNE